MRTKLWQALLEHAGLLCLYECCFNSHRPVSVPGDRSECFPWEGPAGRLPHQRQPGPNRLPARHGASGGQPHRRAGGDPAEPLQKVTPVGGAPERDFGEDSGDRARAHKAKNANHNNSPTL